MEADKLISKTLSVLSPEDYVVFTALLAVSTFIGLFFAWLDSRNSSKTTQDKSEEDYLVGSRSLSALPVALSLTASFMSSITVISTPAEIYYFGIMYLWFCAAYILVSLLVGYVYMPFFYRLGYTSSFKYIEDRFGRTLKFILCLIYTFNTIIYAGIVIYAPALAIEKVCGVNMDLAIGIMGIVSCVYTALGGIKAVIWTDVVQYISMYAGFIAIIYKGFSDMGFSNVIENAENHGRFTMNNFSIDPRMRHSFFSCVLGGTFGLWLGLYGTNQSNVQRYISCKSESEARKAVWYNAIALILINFTAATAGLVMFSYYKDCDPLAAGFITAKDQLVPYLVMDKLSVFKGIPGLFLASACSGTLSTVSSGINAVCAILIDELKETFPFVKRNSYFSSRLIVFVSGIGAMIAAFAAKSLTGTVLQAAMSVNGIVAGPMLGLFTLGMFCPWVGSVPATVAFLTSVLSSSLMYLFNNPTQIFQKLLPVSTDLCMNSSSIIAPPVFYEEDESGFQISYIYLSTSGLMLTMVTSNLLAMLTKLPESQFRRRELYSQLIWKVPFFAKYWTHINDDSLELKTEQISFMDSENQIVQNKS